MTRPLDCHDGAAALMIKSRYCEASPTRNTRHVHVHTCQNALHLGQERRVTDPACRARLAFRDAASVVHTSRTNDARERDG